MDSANNQKILGYFIEEAREHLETLAQGLMDLPKVIGDPEEINELFRAAHSVKGGSAMLGYNSIQRTAHRLEDCFKLLKEHDIAADTRLESLFLKGYDTLHTLIDRLEGPFGLQDEEANQITSAAEPDFAELENYLHHLIDGDSSETATLVQAPAPRFAPPTAKTEAAPSPTPAAAPVHSLTPQQTELSRQCQTLLKEMLALFQQTANGKSRKELQRRCVRLAKLAPQVKPWQRLTKACHQAVGNPKFAYKTLAPVVIQDLKQGSDRLVLDQTQDITPSDGLKKLAQAKTAQVLIPVDPKAAAKALRQVFDKQQLSQLAKLLAKA
ncbi:MAG: histidine kinase [Spirulina sp. SIO3F2]|nr:histidine kinase [Spirulina sp. SIO3F2]